MTISPSNILGVVLAGGQSRRMLGQDKSFLRLEECSLIERAGQRLAPQVADVVINANGSLEQYSDLKFNLCPDIVDGHVGPLAGVLTGMRAAKHMPGISHIATCAVDTPFFPKDYVAQLISLLSGDQEISMARSGDRIHPVFAIWPLSLEDELHRFVVLEDKRKILEFANRYTLHEVRFDTDPIDPFFNVNTPEDFERAQAFIAGGAQVAL